MADDEDLKALLNGSADLVRRDFREGELSGLDLRSRDLSEALLQGADISKSDLSNGNLTRAKIQGLVAEGAVLRSVEASHTIFSRVNLRGADLRGGNFSKSHFTKSDLTDADLRGADFRDAVFNDGNQFGGCLVDDDTRFDGASIIRPSARDATFRNYRVERGKLVRIPRDEPKAYSMVAEGAAFSIGNFDSRWPRFASNEGEAAFDYTNSDGRADFGSDGIVFQTKWSRGSNRAIHAYVNGPTADQIAVVRGMASLEEFAPELAASADFSSRSRLLHMGQVLIVRSAAGEIAVFRIKELSSVSHGDERDEVRLEYRILGYLPSASSERQSGSAETALISIDPSSIDNSIGIILDHLQRMPIDSSRDRSVAGIGHNSPPEETPINQDEREELSAELVNLRREIGAHSPDGARLSLHINRINKSLIKILKWTGNKIDIAADEFAKEVGKSAGNPIKVVAWWAVFAANLGDLVQMSLSFLGRVIGI